MKDNWKLNLKWWEESLNYSDPKKIELKTLLKNLNFKGKKVIDVGCGVARLSIPLSKIAKSVIAIDKDKKAIDYCKRYKKRKNINYLNKDILNLKNQNADIAILAQPSYDDLNKVMKAINTNLNKEGKLIIIKWIDKDNYYNKLLSPFWKLNKNLTTKVKKSSKDFKNTLKNYFKIKKILTINTYDNYPTLEKLKESIIKDSPINFTRKEHNLLDKLAKKVDHKKIKIAMNLYICKKLDSTS